MSDRPLRGPARGPLPHPSRTTAGNVGPPVVLVSPNSFFREERIRRSFTTERCRRSEETLSSQDVLFVSVNKSYRSRMSLADLDVCVERAWAVSVAKAMGCDRVVAVREGASLVACDVAPMPVVPKPEW